MEAKFSPFSNERSMPPFELDIGRHIAWDDTNNRAKGFDSIMLQSAVMYYNILIYGTLSFAFSLTKVFKNQKQPDFHEQKKAQPLL